jgi:predicted transcriptional regulator
VCHSRDPSRTRLRALWLLAWVLLHTAVAAAADLILTKGIGCLPVVEGTQLIGIVTKTALLHHLCAMDAA